MPEVFRTQRRVEFRDTDAGGIVHFTSFFAWMEQAEHEFLRHLGLTVHQPTSEGAISWPRVSAQCNFERPARFEDLLDIELKISRLGEKSVTYTCLFTCQAERIAAGKITAVCCRVRPGQPLESLAIPDEIATRLAPFVAHTT